MLLGRQSLSKILLDRRNLQFWGTFRRTFPLFGNILGYVGTFGNIFGYVGTFGDLGAGFRLKAGYCLRCTRFRLGLALFRHRIDVKLERNIVQ